MRDRSQHVLQVFWGPRPVSIDDLATRLQRSLLIVGGCGGDLEGPWRRDYSAPVNAEDLHAIRALVEANPARDDHGNAHPERGYEPALTIGNWHAPQSEATELGRIRVIAGTGSLPSTCTATFEGTRLVAQVREHAHELVEGFARSWQPDIITLTDDALLDERDAALPPPAPGRTFAPWGYLGWMSDRFSRNLEHVEGATTTRFGPGTMLVSNSWDPVATAQTWQALVDSRRIRGIRLGEPQETLPHF
jgi:hypothetical protein